MNAFVFVIAAVILFFFSTFISDYIDLPTFIKSKKKRKKSSPHTYLREQIAKIPFHCQARFYSQELFPGLEEIQENWQSIREEAIKAQKLGLSVDCENKQAEVKYGWRRSQNVIMLENAFEYVLVADDHIITNNSNECPKTSEILLRIEGIQSARFVWIYPHNHIYPHGDIVGLQHKSLTYHLGLNVEACQLSVDGDTVQEEEGQVVVFDPTFTHNINNTSDTEFLFLHIDFKLLGL